jgi:plastocyanin
MKNLVLALIVIVVLVGGYFFFVAPSAPTPAPAEGEDAMVEENGMPVPNGSGAGNVPEMVVDEDTAMEESAPMTATVTYNGSGFSPNEVTIKKGGTVTWVNSSGGEMWVASAQHPTHTIYDGTSLSQHCVDGQSDTFDQCAGETGNYSFTFDKAGTWGYHNHLNASVFGKVIVVE